MLQVFGFYDKLNDGFAVLVLADIDGANVGVVVGDDGGQLLQHAGAVVAENCNFDRVALRAAGGLVAGKGPLDGDAAVALVEQVLHVGTTAGVHGHALAAGDVTDDIFATDGVATTRPIDEQVVLTLHLQRVRAGQVQLAHRVGHSRLAAAWFDLRAGLGIALAGYARRQSFEHLVPGVLALTERGQQVGGGGHAILVGDAPQVLVGDLAHRDLEFFGLALQ